jgi:hypothetical protein
MFGVNFGVQLLEKISSSEGKRRDENMVFKPINRPLSFPQAEFAILLLNIMTLYNIVL